MCSPRPCREPPTTIWGKGRARVQVQVCRCVCVCVCVCRCVCVQVCVCAGVWRWRDPDRWTRQSRGVTTPDIRPADGEVCPRVALVCVGRCRLVVSVKLNVMGHAARHFTARHGTARHGTLHTHTHAPGCRPASALRLRPSPPSSTSLGSAIERNCIPGRNGLRRTKPTEDGTSSGALELWTPRTLRSRTRWTPVQSNPGSRSRPSFFYGFCVNRIQHRYEHRYQHTHIPE